MATTDKPMRIIHVTSKYMKFKAGVKQVLRALLAAQNQREDMEVWIYESEMKCLVDKDENSTPTEISDLLALEPDLVIFHSIYIHIKGYQEITKALKKADIPYLVEPHGSLDYRAQVKSTWKKRIGNALWADRWLKNAAAIIYLCDEEKRFSRLPKLRGVTITNTFPTGVPIVDEAPPSHHPVRLMMLGRIDPFHKGLDRFFTTLKNLPKEADNLEVVIYGLGSQAKLAWIEEEVKKITNIPVEFLGPVFEAEKAKAYQGADIFCMFSRYEGLPLTLYEAAASGLPLLVTEGSNRTDWVAETENGWILWDKDEASWSQGLMDAVAAYEENPKGYRDKALASARDLPTWDEIAADSAKIYREWRKKL